MSVHILPVKSIPNARDLGGYTGIDDRRIKSKKLLRTGKLNKLSGEDKQYLLDYGLKKVIDLRSKTETLTQPDVKIVNTIHIDDPIFAKDLTQANTKISDLQKQYTKDQYAGFKRMCLNYHEAVNQKHAQQAFHKLIMELIDAKGATIFHCSEGKDRTGMATVFILNILGVNQEVIRQDYLYSNYLLNDYRAKRDLASRKLGESEILRANLRSLGSVSDEYLDTALIEIDRDYGGMKNYITKQLGITEEMKQALQELYLEK